MSKSDDWAGLKFKLMKEAGECIDMIFIKVSSESTDNHYFIRSHDKSDGLSALVDLLALEHNITITSLPVVDKRSRPKLFRRLVLAIEHVQRQRIIKYSWKKIDVDQKGNSAGVSYSYFSKAQTIQLNKYCKSQGFNLNSFLLWSLDSVSKKQFLTNSVQKRIWMVPVNMRLNKFQTTGNAVTTLSVHIEADQGPFTIYNQIKMMMKSGIIWGGWIVANIPKYIGERGLRILSKNIKSPYIGLCSNLGEWPPKDIKLKDDNTQWIVASPVTSFCPISTVVMNWNGRLGISCQLHPSIAKQLSECSTLLESWVNLVLEESKVADKPLIKSILWKEIEKNATQF